MRDGRRLYNGQSGLVSAHIRFMHLLTLLVATSVSAASERALEFGATYTGEVFRNASGGLRQDTVYLDNLDVTLDIDAEALWDIPDTRFFVYGLYNNGHTLSGGGSGDLQVISNIETGVEAARLYEAWAERTTGSALRSPGRRPRHNIATHAARRSIAGRSHWN